MGVMPSHHANCMSDRCRREEIRRPLCRASRVDWIQQVQQEPTEGFVRFFREVATYVVVPLISRHRRKQCEGKLSWHPPFTSAVGGERRQRADEWMTHHNEGIGIVRLDDSGDVARLSIGHVEIESAPHPVR